MNRFGISEKSFQLITSVLAAYPVVEKAIVFGSRAKGNFKPGSDIDLAIMGSHCTDDMAMRLNGILNEEIPIPYHVDLICYNTLVHAELKDHIDRVGLVFYEQP